MRIDFSEMYEAVRKGFQTAQSGEDFNRWLGALERLVELALFYGIETKAWTTEM